MLTVKIVEAIFHTTQNRISGISQIGQNLQYIVTHMWEILIDCCELFPRYFYLIFVAFTLVLTVWYAILKKEYSHIAKVILIILCCIVTAFLVYVLTLTSFYTGRLRFTIGATIGLVLMYWYCETDLWESKKIGMYLASAILASYFLINIYTYLSIMYQHKQVNKLEREEANAILQYIQEQEKNNGIEVDSFAIFVVKGNSNRTFYEGTKNRCVLTYSGLKSDWSIEGALKFYTGRNLERIEPDTVLKRTYERKNIQEKEYMCINDTLCVNAFMY